ncbi:hypothetical protein HA402_000276 [Bradysia odoriphaga]|nr:hypothetical protein HA402_000276 [Bradysia odoriphaga]
MSDKADKAKTTYQGNGRCFGEFLCEKCDRRWMSGNSWKNTAQMCEICNVRVFPHTQSPLKKPGVFDYTNPDKPHPQHLCDRCKQLGRFCGKNRRY